MASRTGRYGCHHNVKTHGVCCYTFSPNRTPDATFLQYTLQELLLMPNPTFLLYTLQELILMPKSETIFSSMAIRTARIPHTQNGGDANRLTCWSLCRFCAWLCPRGHCLCHDWCYDAGCDVADTWSHPSSGCGFCFQASLHLLSSWACNHTCCEPHPAQHSSPVVTDWSFMLQGSN